MAGKKMEFLQKDSDCEFIIDDYNKSKPFASFFPGIAGANGIPMWVFYVNRGQCICSIGTDDKEHPMMEFLSANAAYQLASTQGFRTFIKIISGSNKIYYEPFQNHIQDINMKCSQKMIIRPAQLIIEEINETIGLKISVEYFNIPNDTYAGLARVLKIQNIGKRDIKIEGLDGLPLIIPYGVDNYNLKNMRRLVEAFVEVINYEKKAPYFKGKVKQEDRPEVIRIKEGNFYVGFDFKQGKKNIAAPIVDPKFIFGSITDYSFPEEFLKYSPYKIKGQQILENKLPSAMGVFNADIKAGQIYTYTSIIGNTTSVEKLNKLIPLITKDEYINKKRQENTDLIEVLTQNNFILSQENNLNNYARQNFLDNVLRGGFPITFVNNENIKSTLHLYSRKHGDLERDYNDYKLTPTNYSQGNGNYRDVSQNRRSDLIFNPDVKETNLEYFYNLIQLDGFNPLIVKPLSFSINNYKKLNVILKKHFDGKNIKSIKEFLEKKFSPGQFFTYLEENGIKFETEKNELLGEILAISDSNEETDYGHGYWSDHWTYNFDLLENYLSIYPDKLKFILFEKKTFTYYDNIYRVVPREDKYVLWDGNAMQLNSVLKDAEKEILIKERKEEANKIRTVYGKGSVYKTILFEKLLCIISNKIASLDPEGVGIEMESDKPNWYDALNGLPGQLGSSINETLELKRHILFLITSIKNIEANKKWNILNELYDFINNLIYLLTFSVSSYEYWDKSASLKEDFRLKTRFGVSGKEKQIDPPFIHNFLILALNKIEIGINKAWNKKKGIINSYFINKVVDYEKIKIKNLEGKIGFKTNAKGMLCYKPVKFKQLALPLFLEGPVHYLRVSKDTVKNVGLVKKIRTSGLYDKKLKMYKVNESLKDQPLEIGRTRIFTPGFFENESIWLHMEYKYMLELLRCGLYEEFYNDFKNTLVPFFNKEVYGRSILENSSFIVSSANPDKSIHGNGFVARLSGATAEFIHILMLMTLGEKPFTINNKGILELKFNPALPGYLFTKEKKNERLFINKKWIDVEFPKDTFSFYFLGSILVVYHNPKRQNTFGVKSVSPSNIILTYSEGKNKTLETNTVSGQLALDIRERIVHKIDIYLN